MLTWNGNQFELPQTSWEKNFLVQVETNVFFGESGKIVERIFIVRNSIVAADSR